MRLGCNPKRAGAGKAKEMPITKEQAAMYPKNWKEISNRIRFERAKGECEWPDCKAPHGEVILRLKSDPEQWRHPDRIRESEDTTEMYPVQVVLTTAHLNHDPSDCRDENLLALCQLHHLRLDASHHARNSARTRRRKRNNLELFEGL